MAARVVGDREDVDPRVGGELAREVEHAAAARRRDQAAAGDELRGDDEGARLGEPIAKRGQGPGSLAAQTAAFVRQPSAYDVRATSEYGHGLTIARISA